MNEFIFEPSSGIFHKFPQVYSDLDIDGITNKIDRTITIFGKNKLQNRLKYVMSDPNDIHKAISLNQTIAIDDGYRKNMINHLQKIKSVQNVAIRWMKSKPDEIKADNDTVEGMTASNKGSNKDGLNKNCDSDLYFQKGMAYNPYNIMNNRTALTISNRFVMSSIMIIIMIYVFIYLYMYWFGFPLSVTEYMHGIYQGYVMFCRFLLMQVMSNLDWIETGAIVLAVTYIGYQIYTSYKSAMICYEHYCLCSDFVNRYEKMCEFINSVSDLYKEDRYVRSMRETDDDDDDDEDENDLDSIAHSIEYLKSYFTKGSSLGYSLVSQISTYNYVQHVNRLANYIGKVDMLISFTSLMKEGYSLPIIHHKKRAMRFEYDFPTLSAIGIWNPILGLKRSVKNSLRVDPSLPNVVILTGPNKAGKSIFMKSLLLCIYLAQSIGICPAQTLVFTPFRDLFTYLNVPDSVGRESLFEAEVNRCYDYLKKCEELRGFSLGIIDELFTGTNPAEGMAGSYAILNQIVQNPVNITIISTHFHDMLKELDDTYFSYKKFDCNQMVDAFGKTHHKFDYILKPGVSNQMIALSLLEEKGFDDKTVMNAHNFIRKLRSQKIREKRDEPDMKKEIEKDTDTDIMDKVYQLMDEMGDEGEDNSKGLNNINIEPNETHLATQHDRALEYSKKYNISNGLPPVLRR